MSSPPSAGVLGLYDQYSVQHTGASSPDLPGLCLYLQCGLHGGGRGE